MKYVCFKSYAQNITSLDRENNGNGFDTNVNEGDAFGDSNNGCGDGDFDDLILSVLILVNTLKSNIYICFS